MNLIILAAGRGSRMNNSVVHKGLLPFKGKAILSHVIEQASLSAPIDKIVIAVHHHQDQLRQFFEHAHTDRKIEFVDVGSLDERGAGPGLSLLRCLEMFPDECIVATSDGLITLPPNADYSFGWVGVGDVAVDERQNYCNIIVSDENRVLGVVEKRLPDVPSVAWTGLAFIKNWQQAMSNLLQHLVSIGDRELQCSAAWMTEQPYVYTHEWLDVGTKEKYASVLSLGGFDYSKPDEITYVYNDRVIKFFSDATRVEVRNLRQLHELASVTPKKLHQTTNFISYMYAPGETFYKAGTPELFDTFLKKMQSIFWDNAPLASRVRSDYVANFYISKTHNRVAAYLAQTDADFENVNDVPIDLTWVDLMTTINPHIFTNDARIVPFHGDLQFDNIIVTPNRSFVLIDWRDSFDELFGGDVYYELGKLLSGMHFDFDAIREGMFDVRTVDRKTTITMPRRFKNRKYTKMLEAFCEEHGYDWMKVKLISWMIIASMSGVHKEPYATCLYYYSLANMLKDKELMAYASK